MAARFLKVVSPQAHRGIDLLTLPAMLASTALMARRDRPAAALMLMMTAAEGTALLTTDYPPGFLPWMSFRAHNQLASLHGVLAATAAITMPGISPRDRRILLGLASLPIILSVLSDQRERPARWVERR